MNEDKTAPASAGAPGVDGPADGTRAMVDQAREKLVATGGQLREQAQQAADYAVGYTKEEPVKAMLVAAAAGALLMGLVSLVAR